MVLGTPHPSLSALKLLRLRRFSFSAVALAEYQQEKVLQDLFQFLIAYNVVFTLNLIYVLGVIKHIVFGVVRLTASFRDFSIITIPWP